MDFDFDFDFDFDHDGKGHHFMWKGDCGEGNAIKFEEGPKRVLLGIIPDTEYKKNGVRVEEQLENTTASEMGLKEGDVITGINGNKISNLEELRNELNKLEEGDNYTVDFMREDVPLQASGAAKMSSKGAMTKTVTCHTMGDGDSKHATRMIKIRINIDDVSEEETEELAKANENFSTDNSLSPSELKLYPNPNNGKFKMEPRIGRCFTRYLPRVRYDREPGVCGDGCRFCRWEIHP